LKLDIFSEIQKRDCDANGGFAQLFRESVEQARAADKAGFDTWWQVEHHCTPDFSYSSTPELQFAAFAAATERLRFGHAGVLVPFEINHPLRIAERAAMLDHLSGGRLELGLARSGGREWETFVIDEQQTLLDLVEATKLIPKAWTETPFNWNGQRWSVRDREVLPHPLQQPHPRLWHTCGSHGSFRRAGELGVGALGTTMFAPLDTMAEMIKGFRDGIAGCTKPAGATVNNEVGVFTFVHVAESTKAAVASGAPRSALWYVSSAPRVFNVPREGFYDNIRGNTDPRTARSYKPLTQQEAPVSSDTSDPNPVVSLLKREFAGEELTNEEIFDTLRHLDSVIIGDVETCAKKMAGYRDIGVDRLMCLVQMGEVPHQAILDTTYRIGRELIPRFA
jgi:alkanesulfonate monooxygenase SsuD/methylene tetrahydromethanopterin reductase-like flavin-dependent oxidoreductase (luciferase family)